FHLCRRPDLVRASSRCICISRRPPASTPFPYTTLFRSQAYEALLLRLRASRLTEAHDAADAILEELRKVIPAFLTRVDVADRGVAWGAYLARARQDAADVAAQVLDGEAPEPRPDVVLSDLDPEG